MAKYFSVYTGEDIDDAVTWVKNHQRVSTAKILESSFENKIDLNTLRDEEGRFTIAYYYHSKDDTSTKTINLDVIFVNDDLVIQRYELNGLVAQRSYYRAARAWTVWNFVKTFILADENEDIEVGTDTLVFRNINTPAEDYYQGDNVGEDYEGNNKNIVAVIPSDDDEFWGVCAMKMGSYFVPLDQFYGANQAIILALQELDEDKVDRDEIPDWVFGAQQPPDGYDVNMTKDDIGLDQVDNTSDASKPVSSAQRVAINEALDAAKSYTNQEVNKLIDGAPELLNTFGEIAELMGENSDFIEAINMAIGAKASEEDLNTHKGDTNTHVSEADREKIESVPNKVDKSTINGFKIYTQLSQLVPGKTEIRQLDSLVDVISVMPNNSMFYNTTDMEENNLDMTPAASGTIHITKYSNTKVVVLFWPCSTDTTGVFESPSIAFYHSSTGLTKWKKMLNEQNARKVIFNKSGDTTESNFLLDINAPNWAAIQNSKDHITSRLEINRDAKNNPSLVMKIIDKKGGNIWKNYSHNLLESATLDMYNNRYEGVNLCVKFAHEIKNFSNEWAWIIDRINNFNFTGIANCDYLPLTFDGQLLNMQVNIDQYYVKESDAWCIYIDFISRHCYSSPVQWNLTNSNNGNVANYSPYMVSNVKAFLDSLFDKLPTQLQNAIISKQHMLLETRYSSDDEELSSGTGREWIDMGKLWIPTEYEVFGNAIYGGKFSIGMAKQYPVFKNTSQILKRGKNNKYCCWWTATVEDDSSSGIVVASMGGQPSAVKAATKLVDSEDPDSGICIPLCFRIGKVYNL